MTLSHPDALDNLVDFLIFTLEVNGWLDIHPAQRDRLHNLLRETLAQKGLDRFALR